jgi:hypothetical protein
MLTKEIWIQWILGAGRQGLLDYALSYDLCSMRIIIYGNRGITSRPMVSG